jgi:aspartyl-tRNA(Asn)/glutamyl-tRNA(Gln) amidotransferase subunit A
MHDPLHAFLHPGSEQPAQGDGPLAGVTVAVKDNLCTRGIPTTCASRLLQGWIPPYDAHVVERLRSAGALLAGKTNLDEFGMGSSTENSAFGPTLNPWDPSRTPGGSSGGSAAAVASGMADMALGSDTGGSVRQPAAMCGIVGLKPTYGRVSRWGLVAFASSLDVVGTLTRTVSDAARLLGVLAGHDPRDSTSLDAPVPEYAAAVEARLEGLTLGVPAEHFGPGLCPEVERAVRTALDVYCRLGARVVDVHLPTSPYSLAAYYLLATAEASGNLARFDGMRFGRRAPGPGDLYALSRGQGLGAEVKRRILLGAHALSSGYRDAYYLKALRVRRLVQRDHLAALRQCDLLIGPTSPTAAFALGERSSDPLKMYLADVYTIGASLAGLPALSVPCGFTSSGLPIGLHLVGPLLGEEKLLRAARMYERETPWHLQRPPAWLG